MSGPLSGIRVIDFSHVLAGPACAYYLGLLGAEVIKVESPEKGDAMRYRGGTDTERSKNGMSTAYLTQAAGKSSVAIDLECSEGCEAMRNLLRSADVFVENHRPETMKNLGFDEANTLILNPRLIHCAITGYGRGGEKENAPAYDVNIQAASGIMTLTGTDETGPLRTGAPIMDYSVALAAGFAISAALFERDKTKKGTFIDVSMLETAYTLMSSTITDFLATGHEPRPRGNSANSRSPGAGSFPCREGILSLGVNEENQFKALAKGLGRAEWLTDQRFSERKKRTENMLALEKEIADALLARTADEWEKHFISIGVPAAKVRTLSESLSQPHSEERAYLHKDIESDVLVPSLPFRIGQKTAHIPSSTMPKLGANTQDILFELNKASGNHKKKNELEHHPNIICTPHIGFVTEDEFELQFSDIFEQVIKFKEGKPINVINAILVG